ncbi:MAG: tetratricopeptide repeat protein [Crocinitomicaceae bacterium]
MKSERRLMEFKAIVICFIFTSFSFSQNLSQDKVLLKLDSIAFSALEANSDRTAQYANNLLKESLKHPPSLYRVNAYIILGIVNKDKGFYVTSLNHYLNALNAARDIDDVGRISSCLNNIGSIYQQQGNFQKAKYYFLQSLEMESKLKNPLQKSIRYYNIGDVYVALDSLDLALSYFNNSLIIEKKSNNREGIIYALLGVSEVYIKIERPIDASISLEKVKELLNTNDLEESILYFQLMGDLNVIDNKLNEGLNYYYQAEELSMTKDFRVHLMDIYLNELKVLLKLQKFDVYAKKSEKYIQLQQELNDLKINNQLEDLTFQNNLNQKELEITLVQEERDLAIKNKTIQSNISAIESRIVWFLISTLVIMLILIIVGVRKIMHK